LKVIDPDVASPDSGAPWLAAGPLLSGFSHVCKTEQYTPLASEGLFSGPTTLPPLLLRSANTDGENEIPITNMSNNRFFITTPALYKFNFLTHWLRQLVRLCTGR
jgi:hypothetical protein